tara:strand:- start:90 stop:761 length:672 start_codon:yes stop_codon:yes gene_type:complete
MTPTQRWYKKMKQDPIRYRKYLDWHKEKARRNMDRLLENPDAHELEKKKNREYANERRKNIERLDPDRYQKLIQKEREVARVKRLDRTYREKGMISNKKWVAAKRKSDPVFRAVSSIRCVINYALRGKAKAGHSLELIGCTPDFLRQHLENLFDIGMTWKNYGHGHGKWCVDHKRPCASFDLSKPIQQKKCFHYTNLRPLWFIENIIKGSSYKGKRHKHITKT